ncbi:MAG TPA: response regulator [Anaerolineales bacterium]|nr:response regulator [Anaerolineales bacterium]
MAEVKSKILVVEDDLDVAEMLNAYFRVQNYDVYTVNWGEDGVRSCQTVHPDLVILDIRLPDIDGYEVARRLRADRRTQDIPIIFLTEKRERADRLQGLELGADDYITKPFDVQELRLRVRNALQRVSQGSLTNPISGLPEGALVDERLNKLLQQGGTVLLLVSLEHLDAFRESYGFVASDDVLRAFSLMIVNTIRELNIGGDLLGQIGPADFVLTVAPANLPALSERLYSRLNQSLDYFYPIKDREQAAKHKERLTVKMSDLPLPGGGRNTNAEQLKLELLRRRK